MKIRISLDEIKLIKVAEIMAEIQEIESKMKIFEKKYGNFEDFRSEVVNKEGEDMTLWDVLVEWEALVELKKDLEKS